MTSTFVLANATMAVADLGIGYGIYRVYRWASSTGPAPEPAPRPVAVPRPVRAQAEAGLA